MTGDILGNGPKLEKQLSELGTEGAEQLPPDLFVSKDEWSRARLKEIMGDKEGYRAFLDSIAESIKNTPESIGVDMSMTKAGAPDHLSLTPPPFRSSFLSAEVILAQRAESLAEPPCKIDENLFAQLEIDREAFFRPETGVVKPTENQTSAPVNPSTADDPNSWRNIPRVNVDGDEDYVTRTVLLDRITQLRELKKNLIADATTSYIFVADDQRIISAVNHHLRIHTVVSASSLATASGLSVDEAHILLLYIASRKLAMMRLIARQYVDMDKREDEEDDGARLSRLYFRNGLAQYKPIHAENSISLHIELTYDKPPQFVHFADGYCTLSKVVS